MKRRLLIVAVFLLAGAVVNVAVACWCYHKGDFYELESKRLVERDTALWKEYSKGDWPSEPAEASEGRSFGYIERWIVGYSTSAVFDILSARAGWPACSLGYELWRDGSGNWGSNRWGDLRLRPLWSAFVLNTLLYGAVLWLLVQTMLVGRRWVRIRRALCPKCAYPMGESAVCTECGKTLPRRARVATT